MISLAIVTDPVSIFFIVLVIILMAPVILNKLHIPHIIGMIAAGVVVGPYGFDVLDSDSSFTIFGQVGLHYLMFLAGLEIDMFRLKLNFNRGLVFGLLTFFVPLILGAVTSLWILHLDIITSVLLGSMYASHTLIAYPITARLGISKSPVVLIAVVGTIIAVTGSLLTLGIVVDIHNAGEFEIVHLLWLLFKMAIYCVAILYIYPRLTRRFFKEYSDNVTQFVYVLAMVFMSAIIAKAIGLEAVLGAFFAGLVLNRYVPAGSSLMSRIEFVGNALFIPYFLIGVGMMINIHVVTNTETIIVTAEILAIALAGKWLAAWIAQRIYKMNGNARRLLFGLTTAHTAVALAVVTIGYNMTGPSGEHLMDETILNGTIMVILITCAIAPFVTAGAASRIKIEMLSNAGADEHERKIKVENVLIPIANPVTAPSLVELALLMSNGEDDDATRRKARIFALNVRNDNSAKSKAMSRNSLEIAVSAGAAVDSVVTPIERYDLNITTGLVNVIEERDISRVIIGMHRRATMIDSFFGSTIDRLVKSTNKMIVISRFFIPVNTITRIVVVVPDKAQFETGFRGWLSAIGNLTRQLGCRVIFCCKSNLHPIIEATLRDERLVIRSEYRTLEEDDDFVLLSNRILDDDLLVYINSRPTSVSYSANMTEVPTFLQKYFSNNNIMVIYPEQFGDQSSTASFVDPMSNDLSQAASPVLTKIRGWWRRSLYYPMYKFINKRSRHNNKIDL